MKLAPQAQSTLIIAAVVLFLLWYLKNRAGEAVEVVNRNLNPTEDTNLANRGFNWLYQSATGSDGTLGTDIAEWKDDPDRWWN